MDLVSVCGTLWEQIVLKYVNRSASELVAKAFAINDNGSNRPGVRHPETGSGLPSVCGKQMLGSGVFERPLHSHLTPVTPTAGISMGQFAPIYANSSAPTSGAGAPPALLFGDKLSPVG